MLVADLVSVACWSMVVADLVSVRPCRRVYALPVRVVGAEILGTFMLLSADLPRYVIV